VLATVCEWGSVCLIVCVDPPSRGRVVLRLGLGVWGCGGVLVCLCGCEMYVCMHSKGAKVEGCDGCKNLGHKYVSTCTHKSPYDIKVMIQKWAVEHGNTREHVCSTAAPSATQSVPVAAEGAKARNEAASRPPSEQ